MANFLNPYEHLNNQMVEVKSNLSTLAIKLDHFFSASTSPIDLIDGEELRRRIDISETTLKRYRDQGRIPYVLIGSQYRYNYPEVVKALTVSKRTGKK